MEPIETLSKDEADILKLILEGKTNREIARVLGCSVRTATRKRRQIYDKLGIKGGLRGVIPKGALKITPPKVHGKAGKLYHSCSNRNIGSFLRFELIQKLREIIKWERPKNRKVHGGNANKKLNISGCLR